MTDERAREIAKIFDDNFVMARKMGADNNSLALAAATVYTIDDLLHMGEIDKIYRSLERKVDKMHMVLEGE
jgi:hypothetical protein